MDPRTTTSGRAADRHGRAIRSHRRPPSVVRRPGCYLGAAVAGAVLVNVLIGAEPAAQADAGKSEAVSVSQQLGLTAQSGPIDLTEDLRPIEEMAASRSTREAAQTAAQQAQAAADQAELDRRAAEAEAAARAAAETAAAAAAAAAAEQQAAAAAQQQAAAAAATTTPASTTAATTTAAARITNSTGNVRPPAQAAANAVVAGVPGAAAITLGGTRASAADPDGHPSGLALDYMVNSDAALGDAIAQYHIAHWDELGVDYVIWQQRMLSSPTGSWKQMGNRGSATANHMDHVHVNYRAG
jgi:hypothetical protein